MINFSITLSKLTVKENPNNYKAQFETATLTLITFDCTQNALIVDY